MKKLLFVGIAVVAIASEGLAGKGRSKEASSEILTGWMELHARMVRAVKGVPHPAFSRHFAYAAIAAYESIVASDHGYRSLGGQLNGLQALPAAGKGQYHWPASLNAAYAQMLRKYYAAFGPCSAVIDSMEKAQNNGFIAAKVAKERLNKSAEYGQGIANAIFAWAESDGAVSTKTYTPLTGEGVWTPAKVAAVPFWAEKRSLTKDIFTAFSLHQPVYSKDTSGMFYKMACEVYNTSVNMTPEQKAIALHWDDNPDGRYMSVFGHWTYILAHLIREHKLPLLKAVEAYARMGIAMHEATILAWKGKYQYNVLRPVTFIQNNIDKNWQPLIGTPPHPEFPAAHATLSNAAAVALGAIFGEHCTVTDNSYIDIGMRQRVYPSLREAAREAGMSRLYGGIHYRHSIEQGLLLGEAAANTMARIIHFH